MSEGDFVFLLGFPGTTMRYAPSSRLAYADEVAVPALVSDFARKLSHIETHSTDRGTSLKMYTHNIANTSMQMICRALLPRLVPLPGDSGANSDVNHHACRVLRSTGSAHESHWRTSTSGARENA